MKVFVTLVLKLRFVLKTNSLPSPPLLVCEYHPLFQVVDKRQNGFCQHWSLSEDMCGLSDDGYGLSGVGDKV